MPKFRSRQELVDWLTEQAKEKLHEDAMELVKKGICKRHLQEVLPAMVQEAMARRDALMVQIDSAVMEFNANVPEHPTIN